MKFSMQTFIIEQFKIFKSIILLVVIDMVYTLRWLKKSFKFFFHNQSMFSNISTFGSKWMRFVQNIYIPIFSIRVSTIFPIPMLTIRCLVHFFTFIPRSISFFKINKIVYTLSIFKNCCTTFRTCFCSTIFNITGSNIERFFTYGTYFKHKLFLSF